MSGVVLSDLPEGFQTTRDHLHQLAFFALSPARYRVDGHMELRHYDGGFGTPEFDGRVVRIEGNLIIDDRGDSVATQTISTVGEAVRFLGNEYREVWHSESRDYMKPVGPDSPLKIDPQVTYFLGRGFGFAWVMIEELRAHAQPGDDPSEVRLWPRHFDAAAELGDNDRGERASYGASPGDADHLEPYVYVSAWSEIDRSNPYWNDESFNGASLSYQKLRDSDDPVRTALDFFLEGHRILQETGAMKR